MTIQQVQDKILSDRQLAFSDSYFSRDFSYSLVPGFAVVLVGARRVGKTSFLRKEMQALAQKGIPKEKLCYLSFFGLEDEIISFSQIEKAYYSLYPDFDHDTDVYFFLDEIQNVQFWGEGISRIMDMHHCHVIVSESSARYLSVDIATELRGRSISYRFHPLSFREFARFQQNEISFQGAFSESEKNRLSSLYQCYLERGSYPALAHIEDKETRKIILSTYFDLSYSKDIIDRYEVSKSMMLKKLMRRLVKISGFPFTVRKLVHFLESEGFKTSEATVSSYIDLITNTCFFLPVPIYGNEKKQKANAQKLYTIDHTMAVLFREFDPATGIKLEHAVLSDLYRYTQEIFYYRTTTNREIDFVVSDEDKHPLLLVQVTDDLEESRGREKESTREGMKELDMREAYMVTQTEEGDEEVEEGIIHIVPAWRFSLALPRIMKKVKGSRT